MPVLVLVLGGARLGHANIGTAPDTYSHVAADRDRDAAEQLGGLTFGKGSGSTVGVELGRRAH